MSAKSIGAAKFKAECLTLIDEVGRTGESLTVTKRGKPVVVVSPAPTAKPKGSLFGSLAMPGYYYIAPFEPACDPMDWEANR